MKVKYHDVDFCVVGGGMAGLCAAVSAARHGLKVALMQDRPVLGGNASSEIRMWICGAHGENNRETGLLEEIELESLYANPTQNYSIWDSILYAKAKGEKNLVLLLNCSMTEVKMNHSSIESVKGWQLTTETWHIVRAEYFADCTGDGTLSYMSGAEYRVGRESRSEFNESIESEGPDNKTMGLSCLFQTRETDKPQPFTPPEWANKYYKDEDLPYREHDSKTNFWWIELGGDKDSIHDAEKIKDELIKIVFGIWDHMKNHGDHGMENWVIDWIGFLPGKRESRRCMGDYILTQNDVEAGGKFDDLVAYGGWTMDNHFPEGFNYKDGYPTIFHHAPSPFGIPYRCLYSKNIDNLFFAGRNISTTHAALSATRVMATCSAIGQAVGTAASIAKRKNLMPRGVYQSEIKLLQRILMDDDCYLPWRKRIVPDLTLKARLASSNGDAESLRNGCDRPIGKNDNGWYGKCGGWAEMSFDKAEKVRNIRLIFDSDLNRPIKNMPCNYPLKQEGFGVPKSLVKEFKIDYKDDGEKWLTAAYVKNNYQRMVKIDIDIMAKAVRFVPLKTWGDETVHVFSWDMR